jgi:hypothetical protein
MIIEKNPFLKAALADRFMGACDVIIMHPGIHDTLRRKACPMPNSPPAANGHESTYPS